MDKGYDTNAIHDGCMDRDVLPIVALAAHDARGARRASPADVRARRVDVRGR